MTTAGIKALRKIQIGRESTAGTAVAATAVWRGSAVMPIDTQVKIMPEENIGVSVKTTRQYTPMYNAEMSFADTEATFEQLPHILEAGVKLVGTGSADGAGTGKIYTYTAPTGDLDVTGIKTYTIEGGDNKVVEEMEYSIVKDFQLSGKKGEGWKVSANWFGRQSTVSSFTGALSAPTVDELLFQKTRLYIDNAGGTIGTTNIANSLLEATIKYTSGFVPKHTATNNLYFDFADYTGAMCTVEMTLLHNATTAAERVLWRADTPRLIRFLVEGDTLGGAGTTYSKKTAKFDFAGVYTDFSPPNDEDEGSNTYKVTFECGYNSTAAKFAEFVIVNELTTIP